MKSHPDLCVSVHLCLLHRAIECNEKHCKKAEAKALILLIFWHGPNFHFGPLLTFTFLFSHICQSSVGSRMSWSNIFDLQRMCKEAGRVGPCLYPGGLTENLVRPISLSSFHFHFSPCKGSNSWKSAPAS